MAKKKKKNKKQIKNIFKLIGIGFASVFGVIALSIGGFAVFGGFNEKVVDLQGMNFEKSAYVLVGTDYGDNNTIVDKSIKLVSTNEDATKLDVVLSADDSNSIGFVQTTEDGRGKGRVNSPLEINLVQARSGNETYNKGGEFVLSAIQEENLIYASTNVFVESVVKTISLTNNLENKNNIYPGTKFTVSVTNIFPANTLNKPLKQVFYDVFGANYFTKQILYFSSNESIATCNMLTGEVEVLNEGDFTITAYMAKTYYNNSLILSRDNYDSDKAYFDALNKLCKPAGYSFKSKSIEVSGITATNSSFNLLVNNTYTYSPSGNYSDENIINLNIALQAPANSNYSSSQLAYKLEDVEIFEGYRAGNNYYISAYQTVTNNVVTSNYFKINKNINPLYFQVIPTDYDATRDFYLIIRIAKNKLTEIGSTNILCEDNNGDDYVYYAFVKVDIDIIVNTSLKLKTSQLLAYIDENEEDSSEGYTVKANGENLNLFSLIEENLPQNATYQTVRFFVKDTTDCPLNLIENSNEIKNFDENKDDSYLIKTSKTEKTETVIVYAAIYSVDSDGNFKNEIIRSGEMTLTISSKVSLSDFNINNGALCEIKNHEMLSLTFNVTGVDSFNANFNLNNIVISTESENALFSVEIIKPTESSEICKINFTALNIGTASISIIFNEVEQLNFSVQISQSAEKVLQITKDSNVVNSINFVVPSLNQEIIHVSINEGSLDNLQLHVSDNYDKDKLEISFAESNISQINITPHKLCENVSFYVYLIEDGNEIRSNTVTISVSMPNNFTITPKSNEDNIIYINTVAYETVIAGEKFDLINGYLNISAGELSANDFDFKIKSNDSYTDNTFKEDVINSRVTLTLTADFWNESDETDYNFYVLPKYSAKTTSIDKEAGNNVSVTYDELKSNAKLYVNKYNSKVNDSYNGTIRSEEVEESIAYSFKIGDESVTDIPISANSFNNSVIEVVAKLTYEGVDYTGKININVTSNLNIENAKTYLNNGETISLTDLFNITGAESYSINSVTLSEESINKLENLNISLTTDNDTNKVYLVIPADFNTLTIDNLVANITATINGNDTTKENHIFLLNFKLTTLELTISNNDKIYLTSDEINGADYINIAKTYIKNVSTLTFDGVGDETSASVTISIKDVNLVNKTATIVYELNSLQEERSVVILDELASNKTINDAVIGQAFSVNDLITSYVGRANITISNVEMYNSDTEKYEATTNYELQDSDTKIAFKVAGTYKIHFDILKRDYSLVLTVNDIQISLDGKDTTIIYSNLSYNLFSEESWAIINNKNLLSISDIKFYDGDTETNLLTLNYTNSNPEIKVTNYSGEDKTITIKVTLRSSQNYVGAEITKEVTIKKLIVTSSQTSTINLVNGFEVDFTQYFNISASINIPLKIKLTDASNNNITSPWNFNNSEIAINENDKNISNYLLENDGTLKLVFYIEDESSSKEVKTIEFNSITYTLDVTSSTDVFYTGQIIYKNQLLDLISVKYNGSTYNILKDKVTIERNGSLVGESIILNSGNNEFTVKFGKITETKTLTIEALNVNFVSEGLESTSPLIIYPDTKISNYVSAKISKEGTNYPIELKYKAIDGSFGSLSTYSYTVTEDGDYYIISCSNTIVAKLNKESGEIEMLITTSNQELGFAVIAYVEGEDNEFTKTTIYFRIAYLTKVQAEIDKNITIYVGDNETEITSTSRNYYSSGSTKFTSINYEIESITPLNSGSQYSYYLNTNDNSYHIIKNNITVARIIYDANNSARRIFACTSNLDELQIKLKGYLVVTGSGYTSTSLRNNVMEVTIVTKKINVTLSYSTTFTDNNNETYYVISNNSNNYILKLTSTEGSISTVKINENFNPFVAKITNNGGILTYNDTIYTMSAPGESGFLTWNGTNISLGKDSYYKITTDKALVEYVCLQITYMIESYTGSFNICLRPDSVIEFYYNNVTSRTVYCPAKLSVGGTDSIILNTFGITLTADSIKFSQDGSAGSYSTSIFNEIEFVKEANKYFINLLTNAAGKSYSMQVNDIYNYTLSVEGISVIVKNNATQENTAENRLTITNETSMDLTNYIYINNKLLTDEENDEFLNNIQFYVVDKDYYSVTSDGVLTTKVLTTKVEANITNIDVNFSLYGLNYTIYLKSPENVIEFDGDNNYVLQPGVTYYVGKKKTDDKNSEKVVVSLKTNIEDVTNFDTEIGVTLTDFSYTLGSITYNRDSYFVENNGVYSLTDGTILVTLKKSENGLYYTLVVSDIPTDSLLECKLTIKYGSFTNLQTLSVISQELNVNYIEPVIYQDEQYQNVLAGRSLNLTDLISGFSEENLNNIQYSLLDSISGVSLSGSTLNTENSIYSEQYLKINVALNNLSAVINIKIVPQYKVSSMQNNFYVLGTQNNGTISSEIINFYDYFKLYKFSNFDSENLPVYNLINYSDNLISLDNTQNVITLGDFINLTFNVVTDISLTNQTSNIGENVNLYNVVQSAINGSTLTNKNLSSRSVTFSENNGYISSNGIFNASKSGEYTVKVNINGIEFIITINVSDLGINVTYLNSLLLKHNNQPIVYENIYASQNLTTTDFISVSNSNYFKNLNFEVTYNNNSGLDLAKFSVTNTNDGLGTVNVYYNSTLIFSINRTNIICYSNLKDEILLSINLSLNGNQVVKNSFNVRLLPVILKGVNVSSINITKANLNSSNQYSLIYNVATAYTNCNENNINLNNKIVFRVNNEEIFGQYIEFTETGSKEVIAQFAGQTVGPITINFEDSGALSTGPSFNTGNTTNVLNSGTIIAVRGNITYTRKLEDGVIYYYVYNKDNELVFKITSSGAISNVSSTVSGDVIIEAIDNSIVTTQSYTIGSSTADLSIGEDNRYLIENNVNVLVLFSGETYDITTFANSQQDGNNSLNVILTSENNKVTKITANNVTEITYGYFTLTNGSISKRIYVKIYPYTFSANYTEDYTYSGSQVTFEVESNTYILNNGIQFKTLYVNEDKEYNLNNFVTLNSDYKGAELEYELNYCITLEGVTAITQDFATLNGNILTLNKNSSEYFVRITVNIKRSNSDSIVLYFIVKSADKQTNTITIKNNSHINLSELIAQMSDSAFANNVILNLINTDNSYINNGVLYINENCKKTIYLQYSYDEDISGEIEITVINEDCSKESYLLNNKVYTEKYFTNVETNINAITNLVKATLNGVDYTNILIGIENIGTAQNQVIVTYYMIDKLIKITKVLTEYNKESDYNIVLFYDSETNAYIPQNKLGIIYLEVEVAQTAGVVVDGNNKTINYTTNKYFKLNNYNIYKAGENIIETNETSINYTYYVNGEEINDALKFSLVEIVDGKYLDVISGTKVTDTTITANGITLNIYTGEISGTKIDANLTMYIKAYVKEVSYNYGKNYKLFEI